MRTPSASQIRASDESDGVVVSRSSWLMNPFVRPVAARDLLDRQAALTPQPAQPGTDAEVRISRDEGDPARHAPDDIPAWRSGLDQQADEARVLLARRA